MERRIPTHDPPPLLLQHFQQLVYSHSLLSACLCVLRKALHSLKRLVHRCPFFLQGFDLRSKHCIFTTNRSRSLIFSSNTRILCFKSSTCFMGSPRRSVPWRCGAGGGAANVEERTVRWEKVAEPMEQRPELSICSFWRSSLSRSERLKSEWKQRKKAYPSRLCCIDAVWWDRNLALRTICHINSLETVKILSCPVDGLDWGFQSECSEG